MLRHSGDQSRAARERIHDGMPRSHIPYPPASAPYHAAHSLLSPEARDRNSLRFHGSQSLAVHRHPYGTGRIHIPSPHRIRIPLTLPGTLPFSAHIWDHFERWFHPAYIHHRSDGLPSLAEASMEIFQRYQDPGIDTCQTLQSSQSLRLRPRQT